jgi:23S rRNA (uridine2552-2'-O)-methyltransferase
MIARLFSENSDEGYNSVVSDISPSLTGRYDTDQAISLELSAMALDLAAKLLNPGGSFVTKAFQGTGIELLIEACKKRFSFVRRFSPTASRNASSEIYVICKNKRPLSERLDSAIEHIQQGLMDAGVLVGDEEEDQGPVVGFRRL